MQNAAHYQRSRRIDLPGVAVALAAAFVFYPTESWANEPFLSAPDLSGVVDIRAHAGNNALAPWIDGGYGRGRFNDDAGLALGEATLVWRPRFTDSLRLHLNVQYQPQIDDLPEAVEAYVAYRSQPGEAIDMTARLGTFFPTISLEHDDLFWSTIDTITPSAINSWITEEVRLNGLELTVRRRTSLGLFAVAGAVFGANDTAGALLAFRGWAIHDLKSAVTSEVTLPSPTPGRRLDVPSQAGFTRPTGELDDRVGYFGNLEWQSGPTLVALSHYDNAGSRVAVDDGQYAWETRFTQIAIRVQTPGEITLTAQAMVGQTQMGPSIPQVLYDADFSSAFVTAGQAIGPGHLAVRAETFRVRDNSFRDGDDQDEQGWAATAGWVQDLGPRQQLRMELQQINSERPGLASLGLAPKQTQTSAQAAFRLSF